MPGNPLLDDFISHAGRGIHKWVHYFDVYHRCLDRFRGQAIKFVEIGVQNGGSAHLWRRYLGPHAQIIGIDVDPACQALEREGFEIWIGDQADPEFWRRFKQTHGCVDVVLDDGGHTMRQQITTFEALFPALADGGVYLCEDTHTSYFPGHGGGLRRAGTFHEYVKALVDEMHAWYYAPLSKLDQAYLARHLYSISFFDSIVVMEKRSKNPPLILARGSVGHKKNPPAMTHVEMRRLFGVPDESPGPSHQEPQPE